MNERFAIINDTWFRRLYFIGILLLTASLPLSKFVMSVSQFIILGAWLLSGDLKGKFTTFFRCKPAVLVASVYLMHLLGVLWSEDLGYAMKDLRIKLPLLALPVIFSSSPPLSVVQFRQVLLTLIGATLVSVGCGLVIWMGWTGINVTDIRDISPFVSHIRLSLLICLSVVAALYFILVQHRYIFLLLPAILVFIAFLVVLESITGLGILIAVLLFIGIRRSMYLESKWWRAIVITCCLLVPVLTFFYVNAVVKDFSVKETPDFNALEKYTPSGRPYEHFSDRSQRENGKLVWIYVCEEEIGQEWNKRSNLPYSGKDLKGNDLRFTLIRYMTSAGLKKDSAGIAAMTDRDIKAVESGKANVHYNTFGIYSRLHRLIWEIEQYRAGANPSGHSLTMRWEYWKTAWHIIREHPFTGVGTGDLPDAFKKQYETDQSRLDEKWRLRAHNQYLSIGVAFGIPGLAWFVIVLVITLLTQLKKGDTLFLAFWLIAVISMCTEDTLETQAGVTFFALFYCLFLFVSPQKGADSGIKAG